MSSSCGLVVSPVRGVRVMVEGCLVDAAKLVHLRECFKGGTLGGFLERRGALIALAHSSEIKSDRFGLA